jgi:hypothetical protein
MILDVFISCAGKEKPTADAICATLKAAGVRCWTASMIILPGFDWGGHILDALERARVMVLTFSSLSANPARSRAGSQPRHENDAE